MQRKYWFMIWAAAAVILFAGIWAWVDRPSANSITEAAQLGDYWGGHFSGPGTIAASILFFVAILLQRDELMAQREEMKLAREVSKAQVEQLTQQTVIARRSAIVSQILGVTDIRRSCAMEQRSLNVLDPIGRGEFLRIHHEIQRTDSYLHLLIEDESLNEGDRNRLTQLAAVDDLDAVVESYASMNLSVSRLADGSLSFELHLANRSSFDLQVEEARFCCPREVEESNDSIGWTVHQIQMASTRDDPHELVPSGASASFRLDNWHANREKVQQAPDGDFWCLVSVCGHDYELRDGARIKRSILDNMRGS